MQFWICFEVSFQSFHCNSLNYSISVASADAGCFCGGIKSLYQTCQMCHLGRKLYQTDPDCVKHILRIHHDPHEVELRSTQNSPSRSKPVSLSEIMLVLPIFSGSSFVACEGMI